MTVAELIEQLKVMHPDAEVMLDVDGMYYLTLTAVQTHGSDTVDLVSSHV